VKLEGTRSFEAPRQAVWEVLNDPARMAKTMPGVESFDVQDERHWKANVRIPLGLGVLPLSIGFEKTEERPIEYARLHAKGTGVGAIMSMETGFHLSEAGGGGTDMRWEAEVKIAGPVGSMGQRVLQPIVNQQVQSVLAALDEQVREAGAGAEAGPPTAAGASAAEEGVHPGSPEAYSPEPEGPTHSA
jgi:carbon monoxide dehydrogenase subunit G